MSLTSSYDLSQRERERERERVFLKFSFIKPQGTRAEPVKIQYTELTKTEMNNKWNVNFLQNNPFSIQHIYSSEFSVGRSTSETSLLNKCEIQPTSYPSDEFTVAEVRGRMELCLLR